MKVAVLCLILFLEVQQVLNQDLQNDFEQCLAVFLLYDLHHYKKHEQQVLQDLQKGL
jgi:hypothetical protein